MVFLCVDALNVVKLCKCYSCVYSVVVFKTKIEVYILRCNGKAVLTSLSPHLGIFDVKQKGQSTGRAV